MSRPKSRQIPKNIKLCTRPNCVRTITRLLPPVRLPNNKDEEVWNVKALPLNISSIPKPSLVVNNLMQKRQNQHKAVINQIKTQFEAINLDVEAQIRLHAELLKREFTDNENEIQTYLKKIDIDNEKMLSLSKNDFTAVAHVISENYGKSAKAIDDFSHFLPELEKTRSNKYKEVLKRAYEDLHKISYVLPNEIQQYFEHEILKINQMLLSNFRCYSDLQLQLTLQITNTKRLHMQNFDALNTKWKRRKKRDVLFKLNEYKLVKADCEAIMLQTEQGKIVSKMFKDKEKNMGEMWAHLSPLPISTQDVNLWSESTQKTINSLDYFARKLITMYKMAIVQVFDGYFDELQNLTESMLEMGITDTDEISAMSLDICKPTIDSVTRKYSDELVNLELLWDSVMTQLQEKLQSTYLFLNSAAHLWDSHFQRIEETKQIVMKDLKKVIQKNDKINQDLEINLNIAIDALRQASTETILKDVQEDVNTLLDNLLKTYNSHHVAEVKVIEKYEILMTDEAEVLLAELEQFLHDNPKDSEGPTKMKTRSSQCKNFLNSNSSFLPHRMKQCEYQVDAVHNWMFGLREAIERYIATCKDEITQQAIQWTQEHAKKLEKRLDVKLAIHTPRYARVKFDVYDIRLAELKCHNDRITRHKAGAEKELEDIKQLNKDQEIKYQSIMEEYYTKIDNVNSKMKTANTTTAIKAYIMELNYNFNVCNKKIKDLVQNQQNMFQTKLTDITTTAVQFSKQLKLFLEEGNFHFDEAKGTTKDLKTFEKSIKKKFNAIVKEINTKEKKMFIQIQQKGKQSSSVLTYSLEEYEYYDKAIATIKRIQTDIKTEVSNIKILINKLEQSFEDMKYNCSIKIGEVTNLDDFEKHFTQIVSDLQDISNCLYQPEPTINVSGERHGEQNINSKRRSGRKLTGNDDYVSLLFKYEPTENESFMFKICIDLYKSFQTLQNEAAVFYERHSDIVNENKLQPSYNEFMEEVLQKYKFYHLQCEMVWLNLTNEFIRILHQLHEFFSSYHNTFFEKHYYLQIEKFCKKHIELSEKLSQIKQTDMQALNHIHKKLKPLHGYKNNKYLLVALEQEMEKTLQHIRDTNINDLLQPYQECQENHKALYESEFTETRSKLISLYKYFNVLLNDPLIEQFEEKLMHMTTFLQEMAQSGEDDNDLSAAYASITISPEFGENLKNISMLLATDYNQNNNITHEDNMELQDLLQRFNNEYNQCMFFVNDTVATWYTDYNIFEKIFKVDIQKILKLYSVKYDLL